MNVREIMTRPLHTCNLDTPLATASRRMKETGVGMLTVLDAHGKPAGILTDRDLAMAIGQSHRNASYIWAHEAMTAHVHTCSPEDNLHRALERMSEARVRRLPVVTADGDLQGLLSIDDIILWGVKPGGVTQKELTRALAAICSAHHPLFEEVVVDEVTVDM